jgi:hypothetical protein
VERDGAAGRSATPGGMPWSGDAPDPDGVTPGATPGDNPRTAGDDGLEAGGTGEPRVDAALKLLDRLPELPVREHAELYEQVREQLSDVLGELDTGPRD